VWPSEFRSGGGGPSRGPGGRLPEASPVPRRPATRGMTSNRYRLVACLEGGAAP
jgi:hypothetical protein